MIDLVRRIEQLERRLKDLERMEAGVGGNFTPTLVGSGTAGTFTYDTTNSKIEYTRIGDRAFFNGRVVCTATSVAPTGNVTINGFPFTAAASTNNGQIAGGATVVATGVNMPAGYTQIQGIILAGATSMRLYETGDNVSTAIMQGSEIPAVFDFYISGSCRVA